MSPPPLERLVDRTRRALRARLTPATRRKIAFARVRARQPTAPLRQLPAFLILGGQRCGSTSIHQYLVAHPGVRRSLRKEVGYYSRFWSYGESWYRCHFPLVTDSRVSFDTTPDYLFDPRTPERVAAHLPDAPLIALLRDPVERTFSAYKHVHGLGKEELSFEQALDAEPDRLARAMESEEPGRPFFLNSYVARSLYAEQLKRWYTQVPKERLLVLFAEDFYSNPEAVLHRVEDFVGLPRWVPASFRNWSYDKKATATARRETSMSPEIRARLDARFAEPNAELAELLGRELPWGLRPRRA